MRQTQVTGAPPRCHAGRATALPTARETITSTTIRTGILIRVVGQPSPASYRAGA
ncbi:hypothetical protein ACF1BU_12585 [Streptomyces sp. NPDC014724]|uniref:hypothetical protein n=1 Tax=unclassified Streptomyces TaxID=2593676 RepID=UPI0036FFFC54